MLNNNDPHGVVREQHDNFAVNVCVWVIHREWRMKQPPAASWQLNWPLRSLFLHTSCISKFSFVLDFAARAGIRAHVVAGRVCERIPAPAFSYSHSLFLSWLNICTMKGAPQRGRPTCNEFRYQGVKLRAPDMQLSLLILS